MACSGRGSARLGSQLGDTERIAIIPVCSTPARPVPPRAYSALICHLYEKYRRNANTVALTSQRQRGTCQTQPARPPSCRGRGGRGGVGEWGERRGQGASQHADWNLLGPSTSYTLNHGGCNQGLTMPRASMRARGCALHCQCRHLAEPWLDRAPPAHLHHRSPRVRKQATEWRARWCIQPCCRSCAMMASILGGTRGGTRRWVGPASSGAGTPSALRRRASCPQAGWPAPAACRNMAVPYASGWRLRHTAPAPCLQAGGRRPAATTDALFKGLMGVSII